jgi:hypothetical protein
MNVDDYSGLGSYVGAIGEEVVCRCFDFESTIVSAKAVQLLSNPSIGEILLSNDEVKYQAVSNLVWFVDSADPFRVAREALVFIDRHILANPGILNSSIPENRKLSMLAEFIEQYSDGLIFPLTGRMVLCLTPSRDLFSCRAFQTVLDSLVGELKLATIRTGLVSSLLSGSSQVSAASQEQALTKSVSTKRRLNCVLEILSSVIQILPPQQSVLSDDIISLLLETLEIWDEYEERNPLPIGTLSLSQQVVVTECEKHGLRPTRYCFEIIYIIITTANTTKPIREIDAQRLQTESTYRRRIFDETKILLLESRNMST